MGRCACGTRQPVLACLEGHTGFDNSAAFSPDGRRIVTASDDNADLVRRTAPVALPRQHAARPVIRHASLIGRATYWIGTNVTKCEPTRVKRYGASAVMLGCGA